MVALGFRQQVAAALARAPQAGERRNERRMIDWTSTGVVVSERIKLDSHRPDEPRRTDIRRRKDNLLAALRSSRRLFARRGIAKALCRSEKFCCYATQEENFSNGDREDRAIRSSRHCEGTEQTGLQLRLAAHNNDDENNSLKCCVFGEAPSCPLGARWNLLLGHRVYNELITAD